MCIRDTLASTPIAPGRGAPDSGVRGFAARRAARQSCAARSPQLCRSAKARRRRTSSGARAERASRSTAAAKAAGSSASVTSSVSSERTAGSDVETTGRPAARYSSVFSGKLYWLNSVAP